MYLSSIIIQAKRTRGGVAESKLFRKKGETIMQILTYTTR